jgi:phosphatidate cytidylyltransferase
VEIFGEDWRPDKSGVMPYLETEGISQDFDLSTGIGLMLQARYSRDRSNAVVENLNDRIRSWWIMIVLMGIALIGGHAGATLLFAFCSFAALREVITLQDIRRSDHWAILAAFFAALPAQYYLIYTEWYGLYSILIPVYAFLLIPIIAVLRGDTEGFLMRVAGVQWALMICVYCISHVPALLSLDIVGFTALSHSLSSARTIFALLNSVFCAIEAIAAAEGAFKVGTNLMLSAPSIASLAGGLSFQVTSAGGAGASVRFTAEPRVARSSE